MSPMEGSIMYQKRFENILRVAKKVTSSLNIGEILEMIRDAVKTSIPKAKEACLLMVDPEAGHYTRPLHSVHKERINCQLYKRGRTNIQSALAKPSPCFLRQTSQSFTYSPCGCAVFRGFPAHHTGKHPLAVPTNVTSE